MKNTAFSYLGCACLVLSAFLAGLYLGQRTSGNVQTDLWVPSESVTAPTETQAPTQAQTSTETQAPTSDQETQPTQATKPATGRININTASVEQLMTLPGIGETYARRIVEYRTLNGPFKKISDITKVEGIGTKRFEAIKGLITTGG